MADPTDVPSAVRLTKSPSWKESVDALRATTKWMVAAFAAVGGVLFTKGFVTTPQLSWSANAGQLWVALAAGVVGVLGVAALIGLAVDTLRPRVTELTALDPAYRDLVERTPGYLPKDCTSVAQFLEIYQEERAAFARNSEEFESIRRELADADELPAARRATLGARKEALQRGLDHLGNRLVVYEDYHVDLLDRAQWWQANRGWWTHRTAMIMAAVVTALGGIGYQLALATSATDSVADPPPVAAAPVVGSLTKGVGEAANLLWSRLDLAACQPDPDTPVVPVVVGSGSGTPAAPYEVTTLRSGNVDCRVTTFTVIDEVARVDVPQIPTLTIVYTPGPTGTVTP